MLTQARRATAVVGATLTAPVNAVLCLALAILVAAVATTPRLWIDKVAREHLSGHPSLVEAAVTIERVGQRGVMTAALLLTALLVARRLRAWGPVWLALLTPVAVTAVVGAAKLVVGRPFPREPMEQAVPLSGHLALPSGHAAGAVVFWAVGMAVLAAAWPSWNRVRLLVPAVMAAVVTVSSLLRGTHWASDLIAGVLLGAVLASGLLRLARVEGWLPSPAVLPATDEPAQRETSQRGVAEDDGQRAADANPRPAAAPRTRRHAVVELDHEDTQPHLPRPAPRLLVRRRDQERDRQPAGAEDAPAPTGHDGRVRVGAVDAADLG
jgi:membrane-associated phospholipid phosphatase